MAVSEEKSFVIKCWLHPCWEQRMKKLSDEMKRRSSRTEPLRLEIQNSKLWMPWSWTPWWSRRAESREDNFNNPSSYISEQNANFILIYLFVLLCIMLCLPALLPLIGQALQVIQARYGPKLVQFGPLKWAIWYGPYLVVQSKIQSLTNVYYLRY